MRFFIVTLWLISYYIKDSNADLSSYFSQHGIHGEFHFEIDESSKNVIKISSFLEATIQYPNQVWSWGVYENPVDYSIVNPKKRCNLNNFGRKLINFDEDLGLLIIPGNETTVWSTSYNVTGLNGMWGRSLVLTNLDDNYHVCAGIITKKSEELVAEAKFRTGIKGSILFRWINSKTLPNVMVMISSNLYTAVNGTKANQNKISQYSWKIFATDIFDTSTHRIEENCNIIQTIYDPQNLGKSKSIGDIDLRTQKMKVLESVDENLQFQTFTDDLFILLPTDLKDASRKLFVVLMDKLKFVGCSQLQLLEPNNLKTFVNFENIKGEISFVQGSRFEPTWINFLVTVLSNDTTENLLFANSLSGYKIHDLPPLSVSRGCESSKLVYNPAKLSSNNLPPPGLGTQDQYFIGDLTGKLLGRNKLEKHIYLLPKEITRELNGMYWDVFLPLQGIHSIYNRGFYMYRHDTSNATAPTEKIWGCSSISMYEKYTNYQVPMETAQVLFRYPIVGKIVFRQPKEKPWLDTTILIEYLIHADGASLNNSDSHRWAVHSEVPDKDYYSWQHRCMSTKDIYESADLSKRLGEIAISGTLKNSIQVSRALFTDPNLYLSGYRSIIGKSIVIYDENGPVARGERLACSRVHRRKAVVKDWFSNGDKLTLKGKFEILQQSPYDITNIEVNLKGLNNNDEYQIYTAPVEKYLEFPCETLNGIWNTKDIDGNETISSPNYSRFQRKTEDEVSDLSAKYGSFKNLSEIKISYNDTKLPLFGDKNILGRSIVIHKMDKKYKSFCSSIERGYSSNEARESRAIASFHHPSGFAYGYIKFTQLIGLDQSESDTTIEVNLRHPGVNDRNFTKDHHWQIYVNPVGVDASVKTTATRCVAGGYVWNPHYTQLADPLNTELYRQECGADNPLRCYVGDLSARLGPIDIGGKRKVFSDSNFPLDGDVRAVGRSIVIFGPNFSNERFACANIEPDHDIVKYINIERPPRFVINQFLAEVRTVMGLPKWMLEIDARTTKILHDGACVQMVMHFKGPLAHRSELDFSRLLGSGRLDEPTLYIPGYFNKKRKKTIAYRTCSVIDPKEKKNFGIKITANRWIALISLTVLIFLT